MRRRLIKQGPNTHLQYEYISFGIVYLLGRMDNEKKDKSSLHSNFMVRGG